MRGLSYILALGLGVANVVSGSGLPRGYPPQQIGSEVFRRENSPLAPRAACVNSETDRQCWDGAYGTYDVNTDYYKDTPNTGAIVEVFSSFALLMAVLVDGGQCYDGTRRHFKTHVGLQQYVSGTTYRGKLGRHYCYPCQEQSAKQRVNKQ